MGVAVLKIGICQSLTILEKVWRLL